MASIKAMPKAYVSGNKKSPEMLHKQGLIKYIRRKEFKIFRTILNIPKLF